MLLYVLDEIKILNNCIFNNTLFNSIVAGYYKDGNVLGVEVVKESGAPPLDEEAQRSIYALKRFPNPPKGLIKDSKIVFKFGFYFYVK